ncbi:hypothetical protein ACH5RR_023908 [Cinchona calisaya]|uniref:Peptidase A1 domain-containing protein n=1 Tax=Cinchona calisaya TaxID=153742 RepID=A0ABD2ZC15_9GENT
MALTSLPTLSNHLSLWKSLFFWLICSSIAISLGVEEAEKPQYHVVNVSSLIPKPSCTRHSKGSSSLGSQKLVVASKNGPCSPSSHTKQNSAFVEALMDDKDRVLSLNFKKVSKFYSKVAASELGSKVQVSQLFHGGEYLTTIGLGTPKVDYHVIMDTGSDSTWVRCKPCSKGCKTDNPLFDPSKSSTYLNGSCKTYSGNDSFKQNYGDGTKSSGHWGCDKLSLEPSDVFENFQFGCGLINTGGDDNFASGAGVLGLGRGDLSLISQTALKFHNTFSYCLPTTSSSEGYLEFGDRAISVTSSSGLQFTSLIKEPSQSIPSHYFQNSLYYVQLLGISVAGIKLNVPSTVFTSRATVIDSGTVLTYLPKTIYIALRTAFKQSMAQYPPAAAQKKLDTCYNVKGISRVSLPYIVFQFGNGANVSLDPSGIVWIPQKNPYVWCLGFAANENSDDITIIGNNQQRGLDILFDMDDSRIGFGTKPCRAGSSSLGSQKLVVASKNGPCSPSSHTKQNSTFVEALMDDKDRVLSLNFKKVSKFYSKVAASELGSRVQVSQLFHGGEYLTTIGLGTPKVDYHVIMDTGSDSTWVRCKPCSKGCKTDNPLFDPSKSSTYLNGSCKTYSGNDSFKQNYGDGTKSSGHWGCDKLSLEPSDVFENFQFGCGLINTGGGDNFASGAGVLGLGRGDLSLISQTALKFHNTFSYCLPTTSSSEGYLEFGDRAISVTSSSGLQFTSLIKEPSQSIPSHYFQNSLYYVQLLGISVAGIKLNVPSTVFTSRATVIDSGTVLTYLPKTIYIALRTAFKQSMAQYPPAAAQKKLDTCYNVKGISRVSLPYIVFQFGNGANVSLDPSGIVWIPQKNPYVWCLGFAANENSDDITIIGNNLQRGLDILFDMDDSRIGFGTKPCGTGLSY